MKIWITADTHFNHKKIIEYGRVENYEQLIKENLLKFVKKDDLLIHLGDVCIGKDKESNNWFKENLGCKTYLVLGNHDNKTLTWYLNNGWDSVVDTFFLKTHDQKILFSHEPIHITEDIDVNYHGHLHSTSRDSYKDKYHFIDARHKLVSLEDNNYLPIELKTCKKEERKLDRYPYYPMLFYAGYPYYPESFYSPPIISIKQF